MHLALQRFQQARPILDFHFALQQDERRDFLQGGTLWRPRRRCGLTRLSLFGQEPPGFPRGPPPCSSWAHRSAITDASRPFRPRLIKQKTAYLVCDEMSSKIGRPGMPAER